MNRTLIPLMLLGAVLGIAQMKPEVAFRAAMETETVKGDLKGAIEQYRKIAQGADRALSAKALLRMAECHAKLGQSDAETIYRQVIRDYADQADSTAEARRRLAALRGAGSSETLAKRRLCAACGDSEANITPDGRWMTLTEWDISGDLAIRDMMTGQIKRLMVKPGTWRDSNAYAEAPVFSPDMKQIAYLWDTGEKPAHVQLRIVPNEVGGKPRTLVDSAEFTWYQPTGWSHDGKSILVTVQKPDRTWQLAWVSVADGAVKVIKSLEWRLFNTASRPRLSPDGRYIAYDALAVNPRSFGPPEFKAQRIYVVAADGSRETEVVRTAGIHHNPTWTPDARHLLFTSDISGTVSLWSIRVDDGRAAGTPTVVIPNVGEIETLGFTSAGTYLYTQRQAGIEQFTIADLQPKASRADGQGVHSKAGLVGIGPKWSPDGKFLAFTRRRPTGKDLYDLVVYSLETGDETAYQLVGLAAAPPGWFHDGKALLVVAQNAGKTRGLYRVDLKTKESHQIFEFDPAVLTAGQFEIAPDNRTLYIAGRNPETPALIDRIFALDTATGQRKQIFQAPTTAAQPVIFRLSPDGRTLAVRRRDPADNQTHFSRVSVDGTGHRELHAEAGKNLNLLAWTSDGRDILFDNTSAELGWRLMRIPAEGSVPVFTGLAGNGFLRYISASPQDSRVALSIYENVTELWALDNVLPLVK